MPERQQWKLSASSMGAFKACPTRFRLAYVEGLRTVEDTDAQRIGTRWHKCLEILTEPQTDGTDPMGRVVEYLNEAYATVPETKTATEWATERMILLYSVVGWQWYWSQQEIETLATERQFELSLTNPATSRSLPHVIRVGKIDRLIKWGGRICLGEYKSTSKPVGQDSSIWDRLSLNTQISTYVMAARELQKRGDFVGLGLGPDDPPISETLYDFWHRPGIKPSKLSQADSRKFVETGEYYGQKFEVRTDGGEAKDTPRISVDGYWATVTLGVGHKPTKNNPNPVKPFAIAETPEMYGARLLADIQTRPEFYFARRAIARTDADLIRAEWEQYHMYQSMRQMNRAGHWWHNDTQCEATFRCAYCQLCYHGEDERVAEGHTPDGFRRTHDLNKPVEEES